MRLVGYARPHTRVAMHAPNLAQGMTAIVLPTHHDDEVALVMAEQKTANADSQPGSSPIGTMHWQCMWEAQLPPSAHNYTPKSLVTVTLTLTLTLSKIRDRRWPTEQPDLHDFRARSVWRHRKECCELRRPASNFLRGPQHIVGGVWIVEVFMKGVFSKNVVRCAAHTVLNWFAGAAVLSNR